MKKIIATMLIASGLLLNANADITLTIDTTTNVVTLVIDGTDTVTSLQLGGGFAHILDFGTLTGANGNNNNIGFNILSHTAGEGNWGDFGPVFSIATSNNIPINLHIEGRARGPGGAVGVTDWAGSIEATYNAPLTNIELGTYMIGVIDGTATSDLTINVIPEPGTAILISGSALALGIIRRSRRLSGTPD